MSVLRATIAILAVGLGCAAAYALEPLNQISASRPFQRSIAETSGVAASSNRPGSFWTLQDSKNPARIHRFNLEGRDLGTWEVTGASNADWEAISIGPCARTAPCIYIGDVGDNQLDRSNLTIYRVPEPAADENGGLRRTANAQALAIRLPQGPRDIEAQYVGRDGSVWLITKEWTGTAEVYLVPAAAWGSSATVAQRVGTLPSQNWSGRLVTDAALSADGSHLAVRTYNQLVIYRTSSATGAIDGRKKPVICGLEELREPQGEGITWASVSSLLLTSEQQSGTFSLVSCGPLP
jgi:hypothetical protein